MRNIWAIALMFAMWAAFMGFSGASAVTYCARGTVLTLEQGGAGFGPR